MLSPSRYLNRICLPKSETRISFHHSSECLTASVQSLMITLVFLKEEFPKKYCTQLEVKLCASHCISSVISMHLTELSLEKNSCEMNFKRHKLSNNPHIFSVIISVCLLSHTQLFATLRARTTVDCRLLCSWNSPARVPECIGLPFPPPGDLPDTGIELTVLHCRQIVYDWPIRDTQTITGLGMMPFTYSFPLLLVLSL